MLVLSRRENESIIIDGNVKLTIVEIRKGKIHFGIEAPREIDILREECLERSPRSLVAYEIV